MNSSLLNTIVAGEPYPMGATWTGDGVNFALFSDHADAVELCLFDDQGRHEIQRLRLPEKDGDVWHGFVPGLQPGTIYGYRVYGPFEPLAGHRFNPHKLLLDPYSRQLHGRFQWHESHFGYQRGEHDEDLTFDNRDNATWMVKSVVTAANAPLQAAKPRVPWRYTTIYEAHIRGFTKRFAGLDAARQGTFSALADDRVIEYIKALGISSIELLPVHALIDEHHLYNKGLTNYWGYNSLSFFALHQAYHQGDDGPAEFRAMVERLHEAGLEVIMDVVYNHSCEGNQLGPTLSFRGIDNRSYYHLESESVRYYVNDTGCGNTLDISHPRVMQLVMDSLRYWSTEMGVDGFRFDLAPVLGREPSGYNPRAAFFQAVAQDPQLAGCKLIAEPWDVGPGGYQLGNFPRQWSEWNDDYRDTVRRFWRGDAGTLPQFARRLHGSSDIFEHAGRKPRASINFITSHDGFTLRDLVTYEQRHNEANAENNHDGHSENYSKNFGVEGPTSDPVINARRRQQQRNLLATLMVSQGIPMLTAGDERNRSQQGNNNAYCQDNELGWLDWHDESDANQLLTDFIAYLGKIRAQHSVLCADDYVHLPPGEEQRNILWLNPQGMAMQESEWQDPELAKLGCYLSEQDDRGQKVGDVLILFNNSGKSCHFQMPVCELATQWHWLVDTSLETGIAHRRSIKCGSTLSVAAHSMAVLSTRERDDN